MKKEASGTNEKEEASAEVAIVTERQRISQWHKKSSAMTTYAWIRWYDDMKSSAGKKNWMKRAWVTMRVGEKENKNKKLGMMLSYRASTQDDDSNNNDDSGNDFTGFYMLLPPVLQLKRDTKVHTPHFDRYVVRICRMKIRIHYTS